jgi:hypothetical protein
LSNFHRALSLSAASQFPQSGGSLFCGSLGGGSCLKIYHVVFCKALEITAAFLCCISISISISFSDKKKSSVGYLSIRENFGGFRLNSFQYNWRLRQVGQIFMYFIYCKPTIQVLIFIIQVECLLQVSFAEYSVFKVHFNLKKKAITHNLFFFYFYFIKLFRHHNLNLNL